MYCEINWFLVFFSKELQIMSKYTISLSLLWHTLIDPSVRNFILHDWVYWIFGKQWSGIIFISWLSLFLESRVTHYFKLFYKIKIFSLAILTCLPMHLYTWFFVPVPYLQPLFKSIFNCWLNMSTLREVAGSKKKKNHVVKITVKYTKYTNRLFKY